MCNVGQSWLDFITFIRKHFDKKDFAVESVSKTERKRLTLYFKKREKI